MKTALKIFAGILVLLVLAAAAFLYTFDANDYKQELTGIVEMIAGRPVTIEGDIDISLYPLLEINITDMAIDNPEGFSRPDFATIGQFNIKAELLPLLRKHANIESLVIKKFTVNFEKNAAGINNWEDSVSATGGDNVQSTFGLAGLKIGGIDIENADLSWLDAASDKQFKISRMTLNTESVIKGRPLPVTLKAYIKSNQPDWQGAVLAKTELEFDDNSPVFNANDLKLAVKALLPSSKLETVTLKLFADSEINMQTQTVKLANARISVLDLLMRGELIIENIFSVPVVQGPLKVDPFDARALAANLKTTVPVVDSDKNLKNISLSALFKTDFESIYLSDIDASADESRINGFVYIENKGQPAVNYDLKIDKINLNDYSINSENLKQEDIKLPLDLIRNSNLSGAFGIGSVIVDEIELNDVHVKSGIRDSVLNINPLTLRVDGSEVSATIELDTREKPAAAVSVKTSELSAKAGINPLLETIMGHRAIKLEGRINAVANIQATGTDVPSLKKTAQGLIKINMANPVVQGIDLEHETRTVVAEFANRNNFRTRQSFVTEYKPDHKTEFNNLSATFKVSNGRLINSDLLLISDRANITGSGSIDFINRRVDYSPVIDMNVSNTVDIRDRLRDHPVEYRAHGAFGNLSYVHNAEKYELLVGRVLYQESKERKIRNQKQSTWEKFKNK